MKKDISKIKERGEKLVKDMGFDAEAIIAERNEAILLNFQIEEPSLLIGYRGEVLESLQHVIRLLTNDLFEDGYVNIVVDINNYRGKKSSMVEKMARDIAFRVRERGIEEELPPMNSYERRIVHVVVSNIADVESESKEDFGRKRVVIKPKKK